MRAKNFVFNRGVSCFIRGVSCFIRGVSCFIRGVSCFIRCILSCFIRYNPVFQSWSSRRERVKVRVHHDDVQWKLLLVLFELYDLIPIFSVAHPLRMRP